MKIPEECKNIQEVRENIDEIDKEIIGLISRRFSYIEEIIKYKNTIDEVYAKNRYNTVISDRREIAAKNNLDPDLIERIYRIIMDYFIKEQLELLGKKQK